MTTPVATRFLILILFPLASILFLWRVVESIPQYSFMTLTLLGAVFICTNLFDLIDQYIYSDTEIDKRSVLNHVITVGVSTIMLSVVLWGLILLVLEGDKPPSEASIQPFALPVLVAGNLILINIYNRSTLFHRLVMIVGPSKNGLAESVPWFISVLHLRLIRADPAYVVYETGSSNSLAILFEDKEDLHEQLKRVIHREYDRKDQSCHSCQKTKTCIRFESGIHVGYAGYRVGAKAKHKHVNLCGTCAANHFYNVLNEIEDTERVVASSI